MSVEDRPKVARGFRVSCHFFVFRVRVLWLFHRFHDLSPMGHWLLNRFYLMVEQFVSRLPVA